MFHASYTSTETIYTEAASIPLPLKNFEQVENVTLADIMEADDEGEIGYILEVDLEYPEELHDKHADFPLISNKKNIDHLELGSFQTEIRNALKLPAPKTSRLRQSSHPEQNYVVNMKFFVHNGIKVTKIHQAVKFHQSKWFSKYIQLNTQKRQETSSTFDQGFYKLMSNSTFGNLCGSLRNRATVTFVRIEEEPLKTTSDGNISSIKIIDEGLSLITKKKQSILWNRPAFVGASILELSKLFMLNFHYNLMKKETQCQLLYSDTDSFVYKIKTGDFYQDLEVNSTMRAHFDFSNSPRGHKLFN